MSLSIDRIPLQDEQAEANAYWADREYKKWVVRLNRGSGRRAQSVTVYVGAGNKDQATRVGRGAAVLMGHGWARQACAHTRLATYRDLGAVRVA